MKNSKIIIFVFVIIFMLTGCSVNNEKSVSKNSNINSKQLTEKEKLDDFEYMYTILKENYPFFEVNKRLKGGDWLANKENYINRIKATPNDESFFSTLNVILSDLNNGHTGMVDKSNYIYDNHLYEKDSELYKAWLNQTSNPKTVERYSSMGEKETSNPSLKNINYNNVQTKDLENGKVGYIAISSFQANIDEDMKIIKPYLEGIKNYNGLIIDIRGNGGGDSHYWSDNIVPMLINEPLKEKNYMLFRGGDFVEQFIKSLSEGEGYEQFMPISSINKDNLKNLPPEVKGDFKYIYEELSNYEPKNSIGYNGKVYLLVDSHVFSSAEGFATFAKNTGFATIVGEKTAGDGIGFDPALCTLPNSGFLFRFSQEMGVRSDGTCNFEHKTEPDIEVSARSNSDITNDQAIQTVLKLVG